MRHNVIRIYYLKNKMLCLFFNGFVANNENETNVKLLRLKF